MEQLTCYNISAAPNKTSCISTSKAKTDRYGYHVGGYEELTGLDKNNQLEKLL